VVTDRLRRLWRLDPFTRAVWFGAQSRPPADRERFVERVALVHRAPWLLDELRDVL
jgi:hypothetical protein